MRMDSYYGKSLEQRAKENNLAIDTEWIKENEIKEMLKELDTTGVGNISKRANKEIQEKMNMNEERIEDIFSLLDSAIENVEEKEYHTR